MALQEITRVQIPTPEPDQKDMDRLTCLFLVLLGVAQGSAEHHMRRHLVGRQSDNSDHNLPIVISNQCNDDLWPGFITQFGGGPEMTGFKLPASEQRTIHVGNDWQGRVWGRTNCSFDSSGEPSGQGSRACSTGDCGSLKCEVAGASPATLAEFTLEGSASQTFYDISLVDGYNLPMAIVLMPNGNSQLEQLPGSETNPSCVASIGDLAGQSFNPYSGNQKFLGTSSSSPLPFVNGSKSTYNSVANWCPWDLQLDPPLAPGDGVYPYPDGKVSRPAFNPCLSACAKYSKDQYCCVGQFNVPAKCSANYYSKSAKAVCPDAYSYAYDDQDSTFVVPKGAAFKVIFCPGGRSTNIIATAK